MLSEKKQELQVAALENGTVIDHIPSERLFTVVSLLGLCLLYTSPVSCPWTRAADMLRHT